MEARDAVKHGSVRNGHEDLFWNHQAFQVHDCRVHGEVFAQSILEYGSVGSQSDVMDSLRAAGSALVDGVKDIDPRTWWAVAGLLLVLMIFTRQSRQH